MKRGELAAMLGASYKQDLNECKERTPEGLHVFADVDVGFEWRDDDGSMKVKNISGLRYDRVELETEDGETHRKTVIVLI